MLLKPSNICNITYDNSGHGNDDAKVNYVADNKMPQQMVFHEVVCCLHRSQIVIRLGYVRQPTNLSQAYLFDGLLAFDCVILEDLDSIPH